MGWARYRFMRTYLQYRFQIFDRLDTLHSIEKLSEQQIKELYEKQLKNLLLHAYQHTPYYRGVLKTSNVINDDGEVDLANFSDVPLLGKDVIRTRFDDLLSDDLDERKWVYETSGGSTGEPARFVHDQEFSNWRRTVKMLFDEWTGYSIGYPKVVLWGSERDILDGGDSYWTKFGRWLRNERWQNAFRMVPAKIREYIDQFEQIQPAQVLSYVESMYDVARYVNENKLSVYSPKSIMVSAGTLYPDMREAIETAFNSKVFNRYGSREVGDVACDCGAQMGMHVSPYTHYVEIIREDGSPAEPGELGEIVISNLTNYSLPMIRYRIGDMGKWSSEPCSCGRHWPLIKEISGRVSDMFVAKDGTHIHAGYFVSLLFLRDWIAKYQIIQEELDKITILIVPRHDMKEETQYNLEFNQISSSIKKLMGEDCQVDFVLKESIPATSSGKYRYLVSKVAGQMEQH